jgi:hypothetical protein
MGICCSDNYTDESSFFAKDNNLSRKSISPVPLYFHEISPTSLKTGISSIKPLTTEIDLCSPTRKPMLHRSLTLTTDYAPQTTEFATHMLPEIEESPSKNFRRSYSRKYTRSKGSFLERAKERMRKLTVVDERSREEAIERYTVENRIATTDQNEKNEGYLPKHEGDRDFEELRI